MGQIHVEAAYNEYLNELKAIQERKEEAEKKYQAHHAYMRERQKAGELPDANRLWGLLSKQDVPAFWALAEDELDELDALNLTATTLVIVFGDHGQPAQPRAHAPARTCVCVTRYLSTYTAPRTNMARARRNACLPVQAGSLASTRHGRR